MDFFLPDSGLVIQADGVYWHSNPVVYRDESLGEVQKNRRRLDSACDS